eukprot:744653-Rhodomonas_salina.4
MTLVRQQAEAFSAQAVQLYSDSGKRAPEAVQVLDFDIAKARKREKNEGKKGVVRAQLKDAEAALAVGNVPGMS